MAREFADILDDSLDRTLNRGESIDACGSRYPEAAAELKPLLELALQGRSALAVESPAEAMAAAREKVMTRARSIASGGREAPVRLPWPGGRRFLLRPLAIGAALVALLSAGTAAAATAAGPDSSLYPLKQRLEDISRVMAAQDLDRARVEVGRADKRLDETLGMMDKDKPEYVPELMSRFDTHIETAASLAVEASDKGDDAGEVEEMISAARERQRQILGEIESRLPDEVRKAVKEDMEKPDSESSHGPGQGLPGGGYYQEPDDSGDYYRGSDDDNGSGPTDEPPESPHYESPEEQGSGEDHNDGEDHGDGDHASGSAATPADKPDNDLN